MRRTLSFAMAALLFSFSQTSCFVVAAEPGEEIELFNGRDFSGWSYFLGDPPQAKMEDVWSVVDGTIHCEGNPKGYLRTLADFENYVLTLEWRFPPGTRGGNSGVLVHTTDEQALNVWPRSFEAQLNKDNAGDIWVIGTTLEIDKPEGRIADRRHFNLTDGSEKPLGEWNKYEITCQGDELTIKVNGELVNQAHKLSQTKGAICLQSEGVPVEFRNIRLRPIK